MHVVLGLMLVLMLRSAVAEMLGGRIVVMVGFLRRGVLWLR